MGNGINKILHAHDLKRLTDCIGLEVCLTLYILPMLTDY